MASRGKPGPQSVLERDLAWRRIAADPQLRKVLVEIALETRTFLRADTEFERGRCEGFREKAMAVIQRVLALDHDLGIQLLSEALEATGDIWLTKPVQRQTQQREPLMEEGLTEEEPSSLQS